MKVNEQERSDRDGEKQPRERGLERQHTHTHIHTYIQIQETTIYSHIAYKEYPFQKQSVYRMFIRSVPPKPA